MRHAGHEAYMGEINAKLFSGNMKRETTLKT